MSKKNGENEIQTTEIAPYVYRQAIRDKKVLLTGLIIEFAVIVVLVILIISLFPLKEKEVHYTIMEDATDKIVTTIKPGATFTGDQLLVDYFVKDYVRERETWNGIKDADAERYRYTRTASSRKVLEKMNAALNHFMERSQKNDFKRGVKIVRVSTLTPTIKQVEFETFDEELRSGRLEKSTRNWIATLKISFGDRKIPYEFKDVNPLHLVVEEYSIEPR